MNDTRETRSTIRRPGAGVDVDPDRLTAMRQSRLLSRAQLAARMSDPCDHGDGPCPCYTITQDAIAKVENGQRRPKTITLRRMCDALDCQPEDLLPLEVPAAAVRKPCPFCQALYGHEPGCPSAT